MPGDCYDRMPLASVIGCSLVHFGFILGFADRVIDVVDGLHWLVSILQLVIG